MTNTPTSLSDVLAHVRALEAQAQALAGRAPCPLQDSAAIKCRADWQDNKLAAAWEQAAGCVEQTAYREAIKRLRELSGSALQRRTA